MQCPKCRAAMPNGAKYCTECGTKLPIQPDSVPNVPQPAVQEAPVYEARPVVTEAPPVQELQPRGMKWFKFLIYFALWMAALYNLVDSLQFFTGSVLGSDAELIYLYYPLLKVLNLIFGFYLAAYSFLLIYTRYRLARFRKNGPFFLHALYLVQIVMTLIYWLAVSLVLGEWIDLSSSLGSLLYTAIVLCINIVYFRKRKHLFVN